MRRGLAACAAVFGCWTIVAACGSVPDVTFGDGGTSEGGTLDGPSGTDTGKDVIVPGCTPSGAEVCDDGVDNDCNGHTDCDDDACKAGFACVDIPAGWTYVPFAESMRPSCPLGDTPTDLKVVNGDGTVACTCSCVGSGATCATGNYTVVSSAENTCGVTPSTATVAVNAAACTAIGGGMSVTVPASGFIKYAPPTGPATCGPSTTQPPAVADGRSCNVPRLGKGCTGTQVCAPKPAAPLAQCVQKSGANACPPVFTKPHLAGSAVTSDNRACTGCACAGPTPCTGGTVSVYDNAMCQTNGMNKKGAENIATTCSASMPDNNLVATFFKSTPPTAGGCNATPTTNATFTGSLVLADETTVCCK